LFLFKVRGHLPFTDHLASPECFLLEATGYAVLSAVPETVDVEVESVEVPSTVLPQ
jgi:hypothetical protein